jgi:predicted dehydrogenase
VDINGAITVRFQNGVLANITTAGNCPANIGHMCLMFEGGRVEVDPWGAKWIRVWKGRDLIEPSVGEGFVEPADNFLDGIAGKAEVRSGVELGIVHSELMEAIYTSQQTGRPARPPQA